MDIAIGEIAAERIDTQRGAQCAAADADVDEVFDFAQRALVDRFDQHAHAVDQCHRLFHLGFIARAAQRRVVCGAAFGRVDHLAAKQPGAHARKVHRLGKPFEPGDHGAVEMRLRPVEQDPALLELDPAREHRDPVGAAGLVSAFAAIARGAEQFAQCRARQGFQAGPELGGGGHGGQKSFDGCAPATRELGND